MARVLQVLHDQLLSMILMAEENSCEDTFSHLLWNQAQQRLHWDDFWLRLIVHLQVLHFTEVFLVQLDILLGGDLEVFRYTYISDKGEGSWKDNSNNNNNNQNNDNNEKKSNSNIDNSENSTNLTSVRWRVVNNTKNIMSRIARKQK